MVVTGCGGLSGCTDQQRFVPKVSVHSPPGMNTFEDAPSPSCLFHLSAAAVKSGSRALLLRLSCQGVNVLELAEDCNPSDSSPAIKHRDSLIDSADGVVPSWSRRLILRTAVIERHVQCGIISKVQKGELR